MSLCGTCQDYVPEGAEICDNCGCALCFLCVWETKEGHILCGNCFKVNNDE